MNRRESRLQAADGTSLFVIDWLVEPAAAGSIMLMHGLGEHCGRHAPVARFFNECGWSVRAYDHRGHGRSSGRRGDVPDDNAILQDAKLVLDDFSRQLAQRIPAPLLFGHSMGGLFAARFATARLAPLRGLILSSPALALSLSAMQKLLLKVLTMIAPGLGVANGIETKYLSHGPAVVAAYTQDPLVHSKISARLLGGMLAAVEFAQSHADSLAIPTLIVAAGDDHLVDPAGSDAFFARLAPGIGTMHRYDDFYHEIFNEVDAQRVFADVHTWLNGI